MTRTEVSWVYLLVRPCSAYYMKYQEQRNKSRGLLSIFMVSKNRRVCFLEFQYLWVYPSHSKPSWLNSWYKIPAWQLYSSFHTLPVGQVRLYICLEISTFIQHSKKFPWLEISTFNMHAHPGCRRGWHGFFIFFNNSMASRHLKTLMFLKSRGILSVDTFPKLWLLRRQNFLRVFFHFLSFRFCLRGWPWAAAPEAKHRCTLQPRTATIGSSSGSSRPRRPCMRRTTKARIWGKPPEAMGSLWGSGWIVDGSIFVDTVFTSYGKCQPKHLRQHWVGVFHRICVFRIQTRRDNW